MTRLLTAGLTAAAALGLAHGCALQPQVDISTAAAAVDRLLLTDQQERRIAHSLGCTIVGRAGTGHYGSVLLATTGGRARTQCGRAYRTSSRHVAIKLSPHPAPTLAVEAAVLRDLAGQPGFPVLRSLVEDVGGSGVNALTMEGLGPSLHDVWETATQSTFFAGPTVLSYGADLLRCLRRLHAAGFVHNDVKPNNVLFDAGREAAPGAALPPPLHLIDFGLATSVTGTLGGARGTPLFASCAAHEKRPTRPVHDVESLVYCLAYLASGALPWERKPLARAAFMKRRMLAGADGCSTLMDACEAQRLTEDVHATETVEALQALWTEVVAGQETGAVDYDACLAALEGGGAAGSDR